MPDVPEAPPAVVLIANDQEWSARSIDSILSPQGFSVIRAYTGQQAIDRALISRPISSSWMPSCRTSTAWMSAGSCGPIRASDR